MRYITRNQLYDMVWAKPLSVLATEFSISGNGLKKICAKYSVPVPQRGYWAKIAAGKPASKIKLPPRDPAGPRLWELGRTAAWGWPVDPEKELAEPEPPIPEFDEPLEAVKKRIRAGLRLVRPSASLDLAHPAIRELLEQDAKRVAKGKEYNSTASWYQPRFGSPFETRRLKLLNSILMGVATFGGKGSIRGEAGRDVSIRIRESWVELSADHPAAKADWRGEWSVWEGKADKFRIAIKGGDPTSEVWADEPGRKLEKQLTEIVVAVVLCAERRLREGSIRHHEAILKRREEMRGEVRRRHEAAVAAEEKRLDDERHRRERHLFRLARNLRRADEIREFVRSAQSRMQLGSKEFDAWVAWANEIADKLDPLAAPSVMKTLWPAWDAKGVIP